MRKLRSFLGMICLMLLVALPQGVKAGEDSYYKYDSSSNTYTLKVTSGKDITEAMTKTLEVVKGTSAKPAVIVIPSGTYDISLVKLNKNYVTISAKNATVKFIGSKAFGQYMFKATDVSTTGIKISGGVWDGANLASVVFNLDGEATKKSDFTMENCTIKRAKDQNVKIRNGSNLKFTNVKFEGADYGLFINNSKGAVLKNCTASGNTFGYGLRALSGTNKMDNCYATENKVDGLQVKDKGTVLNINKGEYYKNYKNGISMTAGSRVTLKDVDVSNNKSNGISPVGSSSTTTVMTAKDCRFNGNGRHGVAGDSYATINITDCEASKNKSNGIMLNNRCKSTGIARCKTNGNGAAGILIQDRSTCPKIVDCEANNNKKLGISVTDVDITVENSSANGNEKHGIYVSHHGNGASAKTVYIKNCETNNNKANGVCITEDKKVTITKTKIKNNRQSGVESKGALLTVKGSGNVISGNKKYGLAAMDGKMYVTNAVVQKNGGTGVYFVGASTSGYCTSSTVTGNGTGIGLNRGAIVTKLEKNTIKDSKQYGLLCSQNPSGRKTELKQCKNNTLSNPKAKQEIACYGRGKLPSGMKNVLHVEFAKSVKAGKTKVTGSATPGMTLKMNIGGKTYSVKVKNNGTFTVKTAKLKKNQTVKISYTDKYKNKFSESQKIK